MVPPDNTHTDSPPIAAARAGGDALGVLLEPYRAYLTLLARVQIGRRLRGKVDPDDVVQETFLEAHRAFPRFEGTTEKVLLAWLRQLLATRLARLVRRFCGTRTRDVNLERSLELELDQSSDQLDRGLLDRDDTPGTAAVRREQCVILAAALGRLPAEYREVIVLRQIDGHGFAEVADRMGRTVDSVQKLWVRALARLRRELDHPA